MSKHARRRSCLTVPGGTDKMLRKAAGLPADEIVLDLEDAVAPEAKAAARQIVVDALRSGLFEGRLVSVRVNAIGTPWHDDDLSALQALEGREGLSAVLPKIESASALAAIDARLGTSKSIALQALIETAAGLAHCVAIAAGSARLQSLILGYGDLASSLGRTGETSWLFAQETVLMAARAAGIQAIDGPGFDLSDTSRLARDAKTMAAMGFDGKWAIHPSQIEPINAAFTPSEETVARARGILAALDTAKAEKTGIAIYEGAMIDEAMRLGAERILSRIGDAG